MGDVLGRLGRRLCLTELEDPAHAAKFTYYVDSEKLPVTAQAELLGVSTRTISQWRRDKPVRQNAERVKHVAKLLTYLAPTMTPSGVLLWFKAPTEPV